MKCIEKVGTTAYSAELVKKITELYMYKGKDFYYESFLKDTLKARVRLTVEHDCKYAAKILGLSLTENRINAILKREAEPKTREEILFANMKNTFTFIQENSERIELKSNEFLSLANRIFKNYDNVEYRTYKKKVRVNLLEEEKNCFLRDQVSQEMEAYQNALKTSELTIAVTAVWIDLVNLKCFNKYNDFMSMTIAYCLLFRSRFNLFRFESFYEMVYKNQEEIDNLILQSSRNWEKGFANYDEMNRRLIDILLESYGHVEKLVEDKKFDRNLSKEETIKTTILMSMPQVFTRKQIMDAHPDFSKSTVDRALEGLKEKGMIEATGTGRSASWTRKTPDSNFRETYGQLTLFELQDGGDN